MTKTVKISVDLVFPTALPYVIEGRFIPKARPRFNKQTGQVYMDQEYEDSQENIMRQMVAYHQGKTLDKANIMCFLKGDLGGDVDNLAGAIMDAMKKGKIIKDDTKRIIPIVFAQWDEDEWTGAHVFVQPIPVIKKARAPRKQKPKQLAVSEFPE